MQLTLENFPKRKPNITLKDIIKEMYSTIDYTPNNKEIRLAIDIVKQHRQQCLSLFEENSNDAVRWILLSNISDEKINAVKPFKKIVFKKVIECKDGKHKTVKIIRRRRR